MIGADMALAFHHVGRMPST